MTPARAKRREPAPRPAVKTVRRAGRKRTRVTAAPKDLIVQMGLHSTLCSYLDKLLWILTGSFARSGGQYVPTSIVPLLNSSGADDGTASTSAAGCTVLAGGQAVANGRRGPPEPGRGRGPATERWWSAASLQQGASVTSPNPRPELRARYGDHWSPALLKRISHSRGARPEATRPDVKVNQPEQQRGRQPRLALCAGHSVTRDCGRSRGCAVLPSRRRSRSTRDPARGSGRARWCT